MDHHSTNESDTKNKIFMVAAHLFAQKGFNGVSMREISQQSGVTKPTVYYYFKNKEQIYRELIDIGIEHSKANISRIRGMQWPFKQKLNELMKEKFRDCEQYTDFSRIFLRLYLSGDDLEFVKELKYESRTEPLQMLQAMLGEAIDSGEINKDIDTKLAAEIIAAVFMYFVWKQLEQGGKVKDYGVVEKIVELIFAGLGSPRLSQP